MIKASRVLVTLVLALATVAAMVAPAGGTSLVDYSASVVGTPDTVSPPGGIVLYEVTIRNEGPGAGPADVTNTTTGGSYIKGSSSIPSGCTDPADGTADPVITCTFDPMLAGSERSLSVAIRTQSIEGSVKNTATVAVPPSAIDVLDANTSNDTSSVTTTVKFDPTKSAAFLREGDTLGYKQHVLTARVAPNGVVGILSDAPGGPGCGTSLCGEGVRVDFGTDPERQGLMGMRVDFGRTDPCRGLGSGAKCDELYMRKNGVVSLVPGCAGGSMPCIEQRFKDGSDFVWIVRLNSTDPEFIPPLKTGSS